MLSAFTAVLLDLWYFIIGRDTPHYVVVTTPLSSRAVDVTPLPLPEVPLAVDGQSLKSRLLPARAPISLIAATGVSSHNGELIVDAGTTYYVVEPHGARLLRQPYESFDGVLMELSFGQAVTLKSFSGHYADVMVRGTTGYIHKESISSKEIAVNPQLKPGERYDDESNETNLIRLLVNDDFSCRALALPLQAAEYITYRLLRDQITIPWTRVRPRVPGQWHMLLRGVRGIHAGVTAKTDSIMEWVAEDGDGRLAYVEAVLPDQTLRISGVGIVEAGEYTTATIPVTVWREWRPIFITVTM